MSVEELVLKVVAHDAASGVLSKVGGALKGLVGAAVAAASVKMVADALSDCVKEAMEAEDIQTRLNSVLKSTKGVSGMTADSINEIAASLSQVTRFEDDSIVSGQNMLLTFTKIGSDIFPQATEAMLNMSSAMGTDLQSSSIMIGKALNDPIAGITALSRAGVQFTDDQKAMIKGMVEAGDTAGAQKIILGELETQFGGAARAAGTTLAGQLDILKNQFGNVKESIGAALIPVISELVTQYGPKIVEFAQKGADWIATKLVPALQEVMKWIGENLPPVIEALSVIWENVLLPALREVGEFIKDPLVPALTDIFTWIGENLPPVIEDLATWWNDTLLPAISGIADYIGTDLIPSFETLITNITGPVKTAIETGQKIFEGIKGAIEGISNAISSVLGWLDSMITKLQNIKLPDWLTPGSPTPFEIGLWGIADALKSLAAFDLPQFNGALRIGQPALATASSGGNVGMVRSGDTYNITVNTNATSGTYLADLQMARALAW